VKVVKKIFQYDMYFNPLIYFLNCLEFNYLAVNNDLSYMFYIFQIASSTTTSNNIEECILPIVFISIMYIYLFLLYSTI